MTLLPSNSRLTALGVIPPAPTGVTQVRFFRPFAGLRERGIALRTLPERLQFRRAADGWRLDPQLLDGIDLVLLPQMALPLPDPEGGRIDAVGDLCRQAREREIPVVYSADDHVEAIGRTNPARDRVASVEASPRALIERSDAVIVTTEILRDALKLGDKPAYVLPNTVDTEWPRRRQRGGRPRLGWAGSASHLEDLLFLLPAIRALQTRFDFEFTVFGLIERDLRDEAESVRGCLMRLAPAARERAALFLELIDRLAEVRHRHVPFVPVQSFPQALADLDWDIGLCPLLDTPFNRCKSALKFYEYAACGSATVASAVPPYDREVQPVVPNDATDWIEALAPLLARREQTAALADVQAAWVREHRDARRWHDAWSNTLRQIVQAGIAPTLTRSGR